MPTPITHLCFALLCFALQDEPVTMSSWVYRQLFQGIILSTNVLSPKDATRRS